MAQEPNQPKQSLIENEIFAGIFDREDRTGIIAGFIDISILAIGVIVALVWQISLVSHAARSPSNTVWQSNPIQAAQSASTSGTVARTAAPSVENISVCEILVKTTFRDGRTHYVEYRGNCNSMKAIEASQGKIIKILPVRKYQVTLSG